MNSIPFKNQILFLIYFGLSTLITWGFVDASPLYFSERVQLFSVVIAGSKWGVQIMLAFIFLGKQKWTFVKNIGFVCFIGSCVLIPYIILSQLGIANDVKFFIGSLAAAVVAMIYYYYKAVKLSLVTLKWWLFWLVCLVTAIILQLTVIFHIL